MPIQRARPRSSIEADRWCQVILVLTAFLDLSAIAAVASIALLIYLAAQVGHLRLTAETGASRLVVLLGVVATLWVIVQFAIFTTSRDPKRLVIVVVFAVASILMEGALQRFRHRRIVPRIVDPVQPGSGHE